jgi:heme-degrading monooxygenase HmoA
MIEERPMFSVLFEVHPKSAQWDAYLGYAGLLKPELERIDGFVDNVRYRSLTRAGWILSLSGWRDEKSLVRWRTHAKHHAVQEMGRAEVFHDYHLRVGQVTRDTRLPAGFALREQGLEETEVADATTVILVDARRPAEWVEKSGADAVARWLGLAPAAPGLVGWDVFDAVLAPGEAMLLMSWRGRPDAEAFEGSMALPDGARLRRVRVVRDYGMFDRREAPQYYPEVERARSGA